MRWRRETAMTDQRRLLDSEPKISNCCALFLYYFSLLFFITFNAIFGYNFTGWGGGETEKKTGIVIVLYGFFFIFGLLAAATAAMTSGLRRNTKLHHPPHTRPSSFSLPTSAPTTRPEKRTGRPTTTKLCAWRDSRIILMS